MLRVRQLLTEVLLDVTNGEIAAVAHSVYMTAKSKLARGSIANQLDVCLHCQLCCG